MQANDEMMETVDRIIIATMWIDYVRRKAHETGASSVMVSDVLLGQVEKMCREKLAEAVDEEKKLLGDSADLMAMMFGTTLPRLRLEQEGRLAQAINVYRKTIQRSSEQEDAA